MVLLPLQLAARTGGAGTRTDIDFNEKLRVVDRCTAPVPTADTPGLTQHCPVRFLRIDPAVLGVLSFRPVACGQFAENQIKHLIELLPRSSACRRVLVCRPVPVSLPIFVPDVPLLPEVSK